MPGLIGPDRFREVADAALGIGDVDGVEVLFIHEWGGLTRFASSAIHQSTWKEDTGIRVRVVKEGRVGVAASNDFSEQGALKAATNAAEMARVAAPDPDFPGLAPPAAFRELEGAFDGDTADVTPERRAASVADLVGRCPDGFRAAGAYETGAVEVGLANTEGQFCWAPSTQANVSTVMSGGEGGTGYAETFAAGASGIDPGSVGARAAAKAVASQEPVALEPGRYTVVLEPAAVSTLIGFLSYIGFGGRAILEGRSCLSGRQGERVAAPSVTLVDDVHERGTLGLPFDFEGTPRRRVELIRDGVFATGVHDRRSARLAGVDPTGHGLPAPNVEGAFPLNVCMSAGDASLAEMISSTERGVFVTRFHYSNVVNPTDSTITGMTRDGTFLIQDGRIAGSVRNMRFTQSILEALSGVDMVGRDRELASEFFFSASLVPALKIASFNFSSASDH
jgi:predicted Zn-dependent protease